MPQMKTNEDHVLGWALTFLIASIAAGIFGFGGIAGVVAEAAKIIFFVAVVFFAISAIVGLVRGRAAECTVASASRVIGGAFAP
jgi:uncharacterized membrane protein YtjA (UPF0391 family)